MALQQFVELQGRLLSETGTDARSRFVELRSPKARTHVLEAGSGNPIVLVHGGGGMAVSFEPLLGALSKRFHVLAPDRPGCGLTTQFVYDRKVDLRRHASTFLESLFDEFALESATLVGNSMGGYWATQFALEHPERVTALVLIGVPAGLENRVPVGMRLLGVPYLNAALYRTIFKPTKESVERTLLNVLSRRPDAVTATMVECRYAAVSIPSAARSWLSLLETVLDLRGLRPDYALDKQLRQIKTPTLMIWPEFDIFAPPAVGQRLATEMERATVDVISGAGHHPWLADTPRCAELITELVLSSDEHHRVGSHM